MYIANANNCWFTNVGEGFIDIGVQNLFINLKKRKADIRYGVMSSMTQFYLSMLYSKKQENFYELSYLREASAKRGVKLENYFLPDIYILPGMFASNSFACNQDDWIARQRIVAEQIKQNGGEIAFLGLGAETYSDEERKNFLKVLKILDPIFVITRDRKTYELFHNDVECVQGLDCAFWVIDGFDPRGVKHSAYTLSTFNRSDEPEELSVHDEFIRPWHMQYDLTIEKTRYLRKKNLMVSDSPYDYIMWYANADKVYTDLVHATIISLLYGVPVKYFPIDQRSDAFESLSFIQKDNDGFMSIDQLALEKQKKMVEDYIMGKIIR